MNHSYLGNKSPENQNFRLNPFSDEVTVLSMTCKQAHMMFIKYDDILYKQKKVQKIIFCGLIVSLRDDKSPKGNLLKIFKLKDNTGLINIQAFESPLWKELPKMMKSEKYVRVCVTVKCAGMPKL